MKKVHLWLYPFEISDDELLELGKSLIPLYKNKSDKTWLILDARHPLPAAWIWNIANATFQDCEVTIYVMGHTNFNFKVITDGKGGERSIDQLTNSVIKLLTFVDDTRPLKIKFINCRSAHARYPRPVCRAVATRTRRTFTGYAYAADVSTLTKLDDGSGYHNQKFGSVPLAKDQVANMRLKDTRFQVWPNMDTQDTDGQSLEAYKHALEQTF